MKTYLITVEGVSYLDDHPSSFDAAIAALVKYPEAKRISVKVAP